MLQVLGKGITPGGRAGSPAKRGPLISGLPHGGGSGWTVERDCSSPALTTVRALAITFVLVTDDAAVLELVI